MDLGFWKILEGLTYRLDTPPYVESSNPVYQQTGSQKSGLRWNLMEIGNWVKMEMDKLLEADKGSAVSCGALWEDYYPGFIAFLLISGGGLLMMVVMITMFPTSATLVQKPSS